MFTQAMYRQLVGQVDHIGFAYDPEVINAVYDHVVIPAANWLNAGANWDWLTDLLEKTEVPVTVIGIGLQAESADLSQARVSESAVRFIKTAARKSAMISTRGHFTRNWLNSIGVKNAVTTGCPSLYMRLAVSNQLPKERLGYVLQSTRYGMEARILQTRDVNRELFRLAGQTDAWMIFQSEMEELRYLVMDQIAEAQEETFETLLPALYGCSDRGALLSYLDRRGKVFFDLDHWATFLQGTHGVIGTRLHGSIVALNAGVPALIVPHDSRTSEVAEFAGIPTLSDLGKVTDGALACAALAEVDMHSFVETRSRNAGIYEAFLAECGLGVRPEAVF